MNEKCKPKSGNNVDIFSMLSKAQEDFNKTPTKTESQQQFSSTPRAPDVTSQSVMDFFAKAISKTSKPPAVNQVEGEFLIQRLMSNPEHTVEHIEKQQRSTTPQDQIARKKSSSVSDKKSVPIPFNNSLNLDKKPENGFSFINMGSPQQCFLPGSSPSNFLLQPQTLGFEEREIGGTSPLAHLLDTPQKPTLLPPMMFAASSNNSVPKDKPDLFQLNNSNSQVRAVEPLTKNQMLQAFNYLLKNDPDFVNKLHEAYVKSITEMVQSSNSLL